MTSSCTLFVPIMYCLCYQVMSLSHPRSHLRIISSFLTIDINQYLANTYIAISCSCHSLSLHVANDYYNPFCYL